MKFPSVTSPEGLFDYLIGIIILLSGVIGLVLFLFGNTH